MLEHSDDLFVDGLQIRFWQRGERESGGVHVGHDALSRNVDVMLEDELHQRRRHLLTITEE